MPQMHKQKYAQDDQEFRQAPKPYNYYGFPDDPLEPIQGQQDQAIYENAPHLDYSLRQAQHADLGLEDNEMGTQ